MKTFILWGLVFILAAALTSFALMDLGQVSVRWDVWELQTSVSLLLVIALVVLLIWGGLVRVWVWLWGLPKAWRQQRKLKRFHKAQASLSKGLIAQEESDWAQAEKQLLQTAKLSEEGLVHYLTAAKMAHLQQASARRDQYLEQARTLYPDDMVTIGLVEAKLQMEQSPQTAQLILAELNRMQPKHHAVLTEYVRVLRRLKQPDTLLALMPRIKKLAGWSRQDVALLADEIQAMRLQQAPDRDQLDKLWQSLSSKQKLSPLILAEYVQVGLQGQNIEEQNGLASLIEKALKAQWDERLVYQYGRITFGPAYERLKKAQAWHKQHPNSAVLLLTLGRLACQSQLWGQAHDYLRESLRRQPELETFHALAQCYEAEGEESQAAQIYKQAMLELDPNNPAVLR